MTEQPKRPEWALTYDELDVIVAEDEQDYYVYGAAEKTARAQALKIAEWMRMRSIPVHSPGLGIVFALLSKDWDQFCQEAEGESDG